MAPTCCQLALAVGGHRGQQRRTGDAHLCVGLAHPGDGRGDIVILPARLLDQRIQFGGAEAAPPVLRRPCGGLGRRGGLERQRHFHRRPLVIGTKVAAAEQQDERHRAAGHQAGHAMAVNAFTEEAPPSPNHHSMFWHSLPCRAQHGATMSLPWPCNVRMSAGRAGLNLQTRCPRTRLGRCPVRLEAQDTALSRRQRGFESPRDATT